MSEMITNSSNGGTTTNIRQSTIAKSRTRCGIYAIERRIF